MFSNTIETCHSTPARPSLVMRVLRHRAWSPLNEPQHWNRLVGALNTSWSLREPRARVVRVVEETADVRSLWLKPNARFRGFRPGQHVLLGLEVNGVRHDRAFSLSHAPRADGLLRLTIKRKTGGIVSTAAHALRPGQIVRLSLAYGQFSPNSIAGKLLLLSAGSGITPMLSLLHAQAAQYPDRDIVLVHVSRTHDDVIAAAELRKLTLRCPNLRVHLHATNVLGRLHPDQIVRQVADWNEREALLCGPDDYMRAIEGMFDAAGRRDQLQSESFGRRAAPVDTAAERHVVLAGKSKQVFTAMAGQSLLDAAEQGGLTPKFGCRRGICRTCQCRKHSGTVTNVLTGQVSGAGEELIQLCISTPNGAVELAL